MYHYVRDLKNSTYPNIKSLDLRFFKKQLDFFAAQFNVITMEDLIEAVEGTKKLPDKAMLLTFDDGYIDHYDNVYPLLKKYGFQGSFFVPCKVFETNKALNVNKIHYILARTDASPLLQEFFDQLNKYRGNEYSIESNEALFDKYAIESRFDSKEICFIKSMLQHVLPEELRSKIIDDLFSKYVQINEEKFAKQLYMNTRQIKEMKNNGMHFGLHGYDHYWLNKLPESMLIQDITKALDCMESHNFIDRHKWVMNYPYGAWSEKVVELVSKNGCAVGLTTKVGTADINKDNALLLPRFDTNDFPPKSDNYKDWRMHDVI